MNDRRRIIMSRALTHSGDQAWDFAVPVFLAMLFPNHLERVAFCFFMIRLFHVLLLPIVGSWIDHFERFESFQVGLVAQFVGVFAQSLGLYFISDGGLLGFFPVVVGGVACSLGASVTKISVAQDIVPTLFSGVALSQVNSRIRQVDLFSEVASPVIAGFLMATSSSLSPKVGIVGIAIWNLVSFFPEYFLIRKVLRDSSLALHRERTSFAHFSLLTQLSRGWTELKSIPIAPVMIAYAFLWLSALSPHGVLLTSFLKESWKLDEVTLGVFRGLGAIFGLVATVLYPILVNRYGLVKTCRMSITWQGMALLCALVAFHNRMDYLFLGFILISRVGLYSFSLGEQQIRQTEIPEQLRGKINASADALTGFATLALLGLGSLLGSIDRFSSLVDLSVGFVVIAVSICFRYRGSRSPASQYSSRTF